MRYFSIAYRPLEWRLPAYMEVVSAAPVGDGVTDIAAPYPELAGRDPVLGEYATLFALRRVLQDARSRGESTPGDMVGISHYRRFAVTRPTGTPSFVYGVVRPREFAKLSRERFIPRNGTIMFPSPIRVQPTVLGQFASYHPARDLLFFMGLAVDLGLVTDAEVTDWLCGEVMVPAPAIGVYDEDWLVATLTDLERVVDAFESTVAVAREGYQQRIIAFCLERLHGLLLSRLVATLPSGSFLAHPALVVSPDGVYRPSGSA
jgi:hypothetical protein